MVTCEIPSLCVHVEFPAVHGDLRLKGICPEFQVIRGFSQKIPADLLSYDQIHS